MNILHICSYYENILFENLVHALTKQKIENEVYIFFSKEQKAVPFNNKKERITLSYCYNKIDRIFFHVKHSKVMKDFEKKYKDRINDFDAIYAHSLFSNGYIAYKAKQKWGIPYVVMVQNTDLNVFFRYMKHLHALGIDILKNADRIIFASQSYVDEIFEKYIPNKIATQIKEKISVVPYGIDDYYFEHGGIKANTNSDKHILSVATICRNKNHLLLAKAVEKIRTDTFANNIKLTIIGKFEDEKIVKKLSKYSFVECINFLDKKELINYFSCADIFALVSKTETFGLVYAEALSQGCPIIYSKGQGFDQQFNEGIIGYHADANDYKNVACQIIRLFDANIPRENCKEAANKYRWDTISKTYCDIFYNIVK